MNTIIGVIPLYDDEKDSYWMLPGYMKLIEKNGAVPIVLPFTSAPGVLDAAFDLCDGILFTGGHDVDPAKYDEAKTEKCGKSCPVRDFMEGYLLDRALEQDKPVLGICRGIQFFNAHLGEHYIRIFRRNMKAGLNIT